MTRTYDDWIKQSQEEQNGNKASYLAQAKLQQVIGVAMSDIQSDPRWKSYCDHLIPMRDKRDSLRTMLERTILESAGNCEKEKLERQRHLGYCEGLTDAMNLVKSLVDRGEKAAVSIQENVSM
jgi:hypothetical protein